MANMISTQMVSLQPSLFHRVYHSLVWSAWLSWNSRRISPAENDHETPIKISSWYPLPVTQLAGDRVNVHFKGRPYIPDLLPRYTKHSKNMFPIAIQFSSSVVRLGGIKSSFSPSIIFNYKFKFFMKLTMQCISSFCYN